MPATATKAYVRDAKGPHQTFKRGPRVSFGWMGAAFLTLLVIFFLAFHAAAFRAHFGSDEMMNLYGHWNPPLWKTIAADFAFWSKTVRPMGALYYLPAYWLFGLNPAPFSIARSLILLVNSFVFFGLAWSIARSWWVAALAAFPMAYHTRMGFLAYNGAFIYDVLCGGFFFAALLYYVRSRRGQSAEAVPRFGLTLRQTCLFLVLYICALDSKEMAVSLPVLVLAWEALFQGRKAKLGPALAASALTLAFILGKTIGHGSLTEMDAYRPVFAWQRFSTANTRFLNTLFYTEIFTMGRVLGLWGVLLYLGLRNWSLRKFDPRWLFLLIWVMVTPLPIEFLPDRGGANLYIVAGGWAMLAALALRAILRQFARQPVAGLPRKAIMTAGLAACIVAYWHETKREDGREVRYYLQVGEETAQAIAQLKALPERPVGHSEVVFLNDPFPGQWDTLFIAALVWKDPTVDIFLQRQHPLADAEIAKANYVFDYMDGRFALVKRP
jgi:hypothetical protein